MVRRKEISLPRGQATNPVRLDSTHLVHTRHWRLLGPETHLHAPCAAERGRSGSRVRCTELRISSGN
ncbi:hypothetical protein HYPSUDRAFT_41877 [Hypholoma sublateritium FD-334 SS-4]|uniref:Uncharacterized protein n=1 Tax=Hypholoma sublateritium (strain FD-334 SS-4) TaxID=945553 RepID=A0A0D2NYE6_HYPSF|nr:hypothetical protein HYPSUDRAFT_41877 [Hypholoma sublateritium FD-334 SS-4]